MGIVYDRVMKEYKEDEVELSGMFFNFECPGMTYRDLLDDYIELQKDINGDDIIFSGDMKVDEDGCVISATELEFNECASLLDNAIIEPDMTAEQALRKIGNICRIYRIIDIMTEYDKDETTIITKGDVVDFIF